jgi:hypothetical protein
MVHDVVAEIGAAFPEYVIPINEPYGRILNVGVGKALSPFIDLVADAHAPREDLAKLCRMLGQHVAREGRSLYSLQAANRTGGRIAWHRVMEPGRRASFSTGVLSMLGRCRVRIS